MEFNFDKDKLIKNLIIAAAMTVVFTLLFLFIGHYDIGSSITTGFGFTIILFVPFKVFGKTRSILFTIIALVALVAVVLIMNSIGAPTILSGIIILAIFVASLFFF